MKYFNMYLGFDMLYLTLFAYYLYLIFKNSVQLIDPVVFKCELNLLCFRYLVHYCEDHSKIWKTWIYLEIRSHTSKGKKFQIFDLWYFIILVSLIFITWNIFSIVSFLP